MSKPKQLQLFLMPTPGAKPEFLTTLEATPKSAIPTDLPDKIVLENYTRDAWAWKPNPSVWQSFQTKSVDGRNKLPGFLKYLKDRTKSAFGRFADKESILVVSYIQKQSSTEILMEGRLAWDISTIAGCPMKPPPPKPLPPAAVVAAKPKPALHKVKRKGGGLLGNLVASQQRTNAHVIKANSKPKPSGKDANNGGEGGADQSNKKTAQQVMAEFRQKMEEKMLDFDISPEPVLKVSVSLADQQKDLGTLADKQKMTMEILKYMVYESVEETNETWVAYKEPSEFMDELTIAVYKEGQAPPEVLEEINKGELPDEVRGQQRAMQQEQQSRVEMKERSREKELTKKALQARAAEDDDELEGLNQNKRDRRTIEDIQREREQDVTKRAKTS